MDKLKKMNIIHHAHFIILEIWKCLKCQEAIDNYFLLTNRKVKTNKKTTTDIYEQPWKLMGWKVKELKAYLHLNLTTFCQKVYEHHRKTY